MLQFLPALMKGALITVEITVLGSLLALLLAFPAGLGRMSGNRPWRWMCIGYIEFFRGTSLLIQLFWLYFVLPQFGIVLPTMAVAVLGVGLNYGAYGAEVVRGAVAAVPRGQYEAAISFSLSHRQAIWLVIMPQAAIVMIRPWGNLFIQLLKATSLVSLITITEITFRAYQLNQLTVRTAEIFGAVLVVYFCLSSCIAIAIDWADRWARRWHAPETQ